MKTNTPQLRFREFTDEWQEKKLGDIGENIIGLTYSPKDVTLDEDFPIVLRSSNIKNGELLYNDVVRVKTKISEKLFVKAGDILICTRNGSQRLIGKNTMIKKIDKPATFGAFMSMYRSKYNNFISHIFETDTYKNQIQMNLGARINQITTGYLNAFKFYFPVETEQTQIASFLTAVDEKTSNLESKKTQFETYKKGAMQAIFSQKIRFKKPDGSAFSDWEEKKLGELCNITTGKLDANAMIPNGEYRFYTCAKDYYRIDNYAFDTEALLISGNGANVGYIHYYKGKFNAYQRTYVLDKFTEDIMFIKYTLQKDLSYRIQVEKKEGNTPYIVLDTLARMKVMIPPKEEQQKIANFLTSLDNKIELINNQLEQARLFKKSLLQEMFV